MGPSRRRDPGRRRPAAALPFAVPVLVLLIWWVTSAASGSAYYPPLSDVVTSLRDDWLTERLLTDVVPSLVSLVSGLALAVVVGVALGFALGSVRRVRAVVLPLVDFLRSMPGIALIPLFIAIFGPGATSENLLIAWVCVWPVLLSTIDSVAALDTTWLHASRSIRLGRAAHFRWVALPGAMPRIAAGVSLSVSLAVLAMVAIELYSSQRGLGYQLNLDQRNFAIAQVYAGALLAGAVGFLAAAGFDLLQRHVLLRWQHQRTLLQSATSAR